MRPEIAILIVFVLLVGRKEQAELAAKILQRQHASQQQQLQLPKRQQRQQQQPPQQQQLQQHQQQPELQHPQRRGTTPVQLSDLTTRFFQYQCELSSVYAADVGQGVDDRFLEYSLDNYLSIKNKTERFLAETKSVKPENETEELELRIFTSTLQTLLLGYKFINYGALNPINFLDGIQASYDLFIDQYKNYTITELDGLLVKYSKFRDYIANIISLMKRAVELNRTNSIHSMRNVVEDIETLIKKNVSEHPFYTPFKLTSYKNERQRQEYEKNATDSINSHIIPGFKQLKDYVKIYLGHTRPHPGLLHIEGGLDLYSSLIRLHTGWKVDGAAHKIHQIGLEEVKRVEGKMEEVKREVGYNGSLVSFLSSLRASPKFRATTADSLLSEYRHLLQLTLRNLSSLFHHVPSEEVRVVPSATDGVGAAYVHGDVKGRREAAFYVNTFRVAETMRFEMRTLLLHETSPGHHLQISTQRADTRLPEYRRYGTAFSEYMATAPFTYPTDTAYIEGWALYSEKLGFDLGLFSDPYDRLGHYSYDMLRACRLVVDTGIHALNWTRQQAVDYISSRVSGPREDLEHEVDRYITWPGQALAYKIGEMKILELKAKAAKILGDKFDIRDFHEVILSVGPVPMDVLEDVVNNWIKTK